MTGSVYGDTNSFGAIPFSVLATHAAVAVTDNSAILKGMVDHAITNTNLFFQFDTTLAFANEVQANPMQVSDTLVHYVYAMADSLIHDKIYYFRIKGVTQGGTYYGNIKTLYSGTLYDKFETLSATNITPSSATLNAIVDKFMTPVKLEFEYGETLNFDHIIAAVPDSIIDTMQYQVTADISSLLPDKFYYYRLKGISGEGVIFSNTNSLFTGNALYNNFMVTPATDITDSTVTLNGVAEGFKIPAQVYFEVGKSPDVGDWVFTNPDTIVDSTTHIIWGKSEILSPSTTYYFRLVAQTDLGIVYSNLLSFNTAMSAANFQALLSSEVTSTSARFNGKVKNLGFSPDIYFEYGTDQSFSYELPAVPGYINDTLEQYVSCQVTGLQLHTFYYYRMKAVFGGHSYFSNTQKVFIADCTIPNCGFELWNTVSKDFPDGWTQAMGDVSKYSPGYNSNYAVKIQNTPEGGLSALTIGYISDGVWGGVPFNARPDSLVGHFNYNISLSDTAWLGLFLKKNGQIISLNLYNIVGTTGGNFTELKFPVNYDTPETPDSLMMMILCSNLNDYIYLPENWIIVDNIRFVGTALTVPNNDFENWHIETGIDLANWYYNGKNRLPNNCPLISEIDRTTDAAANNFSVKIQNIVMPFYETQGRLSYGTELKDKFPVYGRHHSLTGLYKFFPENGDTMSIHINLYKNGEIIGYGKFIQKNIVDTYSPLITEIKYNYSPFEIPDSASISIQSYFNKPRGRSVLYIDNLAFDGFLAGIKESPLPEAENINFNVYPNPFTEHATVSFTLDKDEKVLVRLFDLSGKQLSIVANGYYKPGEYKINLSASGLNKGFYICVINTSQSFQSRKLVIY